MKNYTLKVLDIKEETTDVYTFFLKQPGLKKINYLPGQYLTLIFRINGRRYLRPYSLSSAPGIDATLNITIKRMYGGVVSNHVIDKTRIGDLLEVLEPMGDFVLPDHAGLNEKRLMLWGSGSGITPLISLAKHALHHNIFNHITLVYGNRSPELVIFADQISGLQQEYSAQFSVLNFYTKSTLDSSNPYILQGRISPEKVLNIIDNKGVEDTLHYICGPAGLKESIVKALNIAGVDPKDTFAEDFEVTRSPEDFLDVFTQNVTIEANGMQTLIEVTKGKSILEAGLDAMIELSYSCQTGDCLLCRAEVAAGKVKMIGAKKVDMLETNECLLCCSFPLSSVHIVTK